VTKFPQLQQTTREQMSFINSGAHMYLYKEMRWRGEIKAALASNKLNV
jgi:hypothetical protein